MTSQTKYLCKVFMYFATSRRFYAIFTSTNLLVLTASKCLTTFCCIYVSFHIKSFQTATTTLSIKISDINDQTPTFVNPPYIFSVVENELGALVGQVMVRAFTYFIL